MQWTVADYRHANHNPVVEMNHQSGAALTAIDAEVGQQVVFDASKSHDPDEGQHLHYAWFHYAEAGGIDSNMAAATITGADSLTSVVTPTIVCCVQWLPTSRLCRGTGTALIDELVLNRRDLRGVDPVRSDPNPANTILGRSLS